MYDVRGPTLTFVTQTHHPILGHHTGYIFSYVDFTSTEPRELFFSQVIEALAWATRGKMDFEMDPKRAPKRMGASEFMLSNTNLDHMMNATWDLTKEQRAKRDAQKQREKRMRAAGEPPPMDNISDLIADFDDTFM